MKLFLAAAPHAGVGGLSASMSRFGSTNQWFETNLSAVEDEVAGAEATSQIAAAR